MANSKSTVRLTKTSLQQLKDSGFRFVLIKGYTSDRRVDYMEFKFFTLVPVKNLPEDPNKKEIYEPINSLILLEWATFPDQGTQVVIEPE
jgi:hypothetical protein